MKVLRILLGLKFGFKQKEIIQSVVLVMSLFPRVTLF